MKPTRKTADRPLALKPAAILRERAEARLRQQQAAPGGPPAGTDPQRLIHELQVHQLELEMQNEELLAAHDAREAALQKYGDLYDFAPVGYVTLDRTGIVLEANLAAGSLLGLERSRLVRQRLAMHVAPAGRPALTDCLARVFAGGAAETCELTLLRAGRPPAEVRLEVVVDVSGEECRCVLEDITGQKQAEADRLIVSKLEATGVLADGLSHDFNNLLTVIVLNLELAQTLAPAGGKQADLLAAAKRSALVAGELSRELNRFARAEAPVRKSAGLAGLIRTAVRPVAGEPGVSTTLALPEGLWPTPMDEGQIRHVIATVLQNAREAMPAGGVVSIRAENVVLSGHDNPALPPGDYVRVSFRDQGGGIAQAVRTKVFDPYFSTKPRGSQKGMGLGLAISQAVIRRHGGAMSVESAEGAGTTFQIHLPALRPAPGTPFHA